MQGGYPACLIGFIGGAGDVVTVAQTYFPAGTETEEFAGRIFHEIASFDIEFPTEHQFAGTEFRLLGMILRGQRFIAVCGIVVDDHLERVENPHHPCCGFVEILPYCIFKDSHIDEALFFADADLSMPIAEISRFLPPKVNAPIAIASREAPVAVRYNEPAYRHVTGRVFNGLIRSLVLPGLQDTQCGFKMFQAEVAEDVFKRQTLMGWSFDVELLYIASLRQIPILEVPIPWYFNPESKVNVLRDSWRMFRDLLLIRRNGRQGKYA